MKRAFILFLAVVALTAFVMPSADAGVLTNAGKNLVRGVMCTPKAIARVTVAVIDTVTLREPKAVLSSLTIVRQETIDTLGSGKNALINKKPIDIQDVGAFNTDTTNAGLDWLVDGVFYGAATGVVVNNGNCYGAVHHVGKAVATAVGIAVGTDLVVKLTE